jgi:hypothetical protein
MADTNSSENQVTESPTHQSQGTNPDVRAPGGVEENHSDEVEILGDQDATAKNDDLKRDENLGAKSKTLDDSKDAAEDLNEGNVDIVEPMERAVTSIQPSTP